MPKRRLRDLHAAAFVTGASGGLGRAFCEMLLAEGLRVWGSARDPQRLAPLLGHPGFTPVRLDLGRPDEAAATLQTIDRQCDTGLDLVIQNAGYGIFGDFIDVTAAVWQQQLTDMLLGTLQLSQATLLAMRPRQRGTLVHVSSIAAEIPIPCMSGYNVAKAGLSALSESLLIELRGTGLRMVDFRPGDYCTGFNQAMAQDHDLPPRNQRIWDRLEATLRAAPVPNRAANDLRQALLKQRQGIVRSGSFLQTQLAPRVAALTPASIWRAVTARYFHAD